MMTKNINIIKFILTVLALGATFCVLFCDEETTNNARGMTRFETFRDVPGVTDEEIAAIEKLREEGRTFTLASFRSTELFERRDGSFGGFVQLFGERLSEFFEIDFKTDIQGFNTMTENLANGTLDFAVMSDIPTRRQNYMVAGPIAQRSLIMLRDKDSDPIDIVRRERLPRFVFMENSIMLKSIEATLEPGTFETIIVPNEDSVFHVLTNNIADVFVTTNNMEAMFDHLGNEVRAERFFPPIYYSAIILAQNPQLEPVVSVLSKALASGSYDYLAEIYRQGYKDYMRDKFLSRLTSEERDYMRANPVIPFATHYMAYPISFFNRNERAWQGIVFDIMEQLQILTGLKFKNIHESELLEVGELMRMLDEGSVFFMPYVIFSESRKDRYHWSQTSYFQDRFALLSKLDSPNLEVNDIPFQRVGMAEGTAFAEKFHLWFPNAVNVMEYPSTDMAFEALERGEVDYVMSSLSRLTALTNYYEYSDYKVNFLFDEEFEILSAFNKEHEHLRSIFDKGLEFINTERISHQWKTRTYNFDHIRSRQQRRTFAIVLFSLFVILTAGVFALYKIRKIKMENAVMKKTLHSKLMLDNSPLGCMLWDGKANLVDCNESAVQLFGYSSKEELKEKWFDECMPEFQPNGEHTMQAGWEHTKIALELGRHVFDWMHKTAQGEPLPTESEFVVVKNETGVHLMHYIKDLREKYKMMSEIEKRDSLLRAVNSAAKLLLVSEGSGMFDAILDKSLHIIGDCVNADCVEIWKVETGECGPYGVVKHYWYKESVRAVRQNAPKELACRNTPNWFERLSRGEIIMGTLETLDSKDRDVVSLFRARSTLIIPIIINRQLWGMCCVDNMDEAHSFTIDEVEIIRSGILMLTSAIIRHAQELELRDAARKANEASKSKTDFLAKMSHEIRTPMNAIIGMSDLALRQDMPEEVRDNVRMIKNAGTNLLAIINDILDFSKIESGVIDIVHEDYNITSLINDVVSIIKVRLAESHVRFDVCVDEKIPAALVGDVVRIRQSLLNLLNNAVKFTSDGLIRFTIDGNIVDDNNIILTMKVSDTGRGIREEDIGKLFREFVQVDSSFNRGIEGTGLGLAITKRLVNAMGGDIEVRSVYGKGTEFTITLPQEIRSHIPLSLTALANGINDVVADVVTFRAPDARVLVVDDVVTNLKVAEGLLSPYEMKVDTCQSGEDAVAAVMKTDYDIIFMDHMMPGMDGVETTRSIRELGNTSAECEQLINVPIIALTANAITGVKEMFLRNGFNDYLSKPIDTIKLNALLKKWIPAELQENVDNTHVRHQNEIANGNIVIDGIDATLGIKHSGGKFENYIQTLHVFFDEGPETMSEIKRAFDEHDTGTYITRVHGLKSASANIGATELSELARDLEDAARRGDDMFVGVETPILLVDLKKILANIGRALSAIKITADAGDIDVAKLKSELAKLKNAIDDFDTAAINESSNNLKQFENSAEYGNIIKDILRAILNGDYDRALKIIETL